MNTLDDNNINNNIHTTNKSARPRNRKERRAYEKIIGKENFKELNALTEITKKLVYINLIQKLRELKEKENKNNETATENDKSLSS